MSKQKGTKWENRLVNILDEAGFGVMRSPSSGSATDREQPDVLAGRPGERIALEVKYIGQGDDYTYLDGKEIEALERFGEIFDAAPRVAGRWWRDASFYIYTLDELEKTETDGGNYRLEREPLVEDARISDGGAGVTVDGLAAGARLVDEDELGRTVA
jgi:Holliday junction resolvase